MQRHEDKHVDYPQVMGHRGAADLAPENTLLGLEAAARAGCRWTEVDVMLSRDGVAVLHHDYLLRRTAGVHRRVETLPTAELLALDVGARFGPAFVGTPVPTLREALAAMNRLGLHPNLEIKPSPGKEAETADVVIETIRATWPATMTPPLVSSFIPASLRRARDVAPEIPRALLAIRPPRKWRAVLDDLESDIIHVSRKHLTAKRAETITSAGIRLGVYTVNEPAEARTFRAWGADCIITDAPHRVAAWARAPLVALEQDAKVAE